MTVDELPAEERTECEIWTRAMGYFRPVSFFNIGKQAEHRERKYFTEHNAVKGTLKIESSQRETAKVLAMASRPTHQFKQFEALSV